MVMIQYKASTDCKSRIAYVRLLDALQGLGAPLKLNAKRC